MLNFIKTKQFIAGCIVGLLAYYAYLEYEKKKAEEAAAAGGVQA